MYYEARTHQLLPVANVEEAANVLFNKKEILRSYSVLTWPTDNPSVNYMLVPDGDINNVFYELAIVKKVDNDFFQIESLTAGWMDSEQELLKSITECFKSPFMNSKSNLIIGTPKGTETARFTCGCCGNGFTGNVKDQLKFDQDAGYGICRPCTKYYS